MRIPDIYRKTAHSSLFSLKAANISYLMHQQWKWCICGCGWMSALSFSFWAVNQEPCFLYCSKRRKRRSMTASPVAAEGEAAAGITGLELLRVLSAEQWAAPPLHLLLLLLPPNPPPLSCVWSRSVCSLRLVQVNKCTEWMWSHICINLWMSPHFFKRIPLCLIAVFFFFSF